MDGIVTNYNEPMQIIRNNRDEYSISEESIGSLTYVDVSDLRYGKVKRIFDVVFSLVSVALLLVPFGIISLIIYIDDPGNVLFKQERIGLHGKKFVLYKFRTMKLDTPKYMSTVDLQNAEPCVTRVGHILRKYSLDELPQLINILKGDMSLIGPRPLIENERQIHACRMHFGVYNIRPGITGLAQINGRDLVKPAEKIQWDVKYLENFGFLQDLRIFFATIPKAFSGKDVIGSMKAAE